MPTVRVSWAVERNLLCSCSGGMDGCKAAGDCVCRVVGCSRSICMLEVVVLAWEEADEKDLFALLLVVTFRGSLRGVLVSYS